MLLRPKLKDVDPRERAQWADLLALGFVFPLCILVGFLLGRWIGGLLGHRQAGIILGLILGAASAFWDLYKVMMRLEQAEKARNAHEPGPDDSHDA